MHKWRLMVGRLPAYAHKARPIADTGLVNRLWGFAAVQLEQQPAVHTPLCNQAHVRGRFFVLANGAH